MKMKNKLMNMAGRAETLGMYPVESTQRGVLYIYNDGEYAIITPDFTWRLPEKKLRVIVGELQGILEDVEDMRKMEVRK